MKIYTTDQFVLPLPESHRFPMRKYELLRQNVANSGLVSADSFCSPPAATDAEILTAHEAHYLHRVVSGTLSEAEVRRLGFPWSPELVERSRRSSGATLAACRSALTDGIGINLAGGTHHAFSDAAEGYCVFNDSAIACRVLQKEGRIQQAIVLDCDVHQGNGTASITAEDPSIFTFSIHGAKNFPLRKVAGDLDVPLPDGAGDKVYLEALETGLEAAMAQVNPDLAIYLAGADPHERDRLGRLTVTREGLLRRDELVLQACHSRAIPVAITMAGGYGESVEETAALHFQTVELAIRLYSSSSGSGELRLPD